MVNKYFYLASAIVLGATFWFDYKHDLDSWTWLWLAQAIVNYLMYGIKEASEYIIKHIGKNEHLQHEYDTTRGLWVTDQPEVLTDQQKKVFWILK